MKGNLGTVVWIPYGNEPETAWQMVSEQAAVNEYFWPYQRD